MRPRHPRRRCRPRTPPGRVEVEAEDARIVVGRVPEPQGRAPAPGTTAGVCDHEHHRGPLVATARSAPQRRRRRPLPLSSASQHFGWHKRRGVHAAVAASTAPWRCPRRPWRSASMAPRTPWMPCTAPMPSTPGTQPHRRRGHHRLRGRRRRHGHTHTQCCATADPPPTPSAGVRQVAEDRKRAASAASTASTASLVRVRRGSSGAH